MLRRLLGRPDAGRQAVLVLLPVVIGAALLLASGDRPSTGSSVLETTRGPAWPMLLDAPAPTSTSVASATPVGEQRAGARIVGALSAAAGRTKSTSAPDPDTAVSTGSATEAAGFPSALEGDTAPRAALPVADAPTDEESTTTGAPVAEAAKAAPPAEAARPAEAAEAAPIARATPNTRAAEATTTTTTAARAPGPTTTTGGRARDTGVEAEVVPLTNQDRRAQGLGALSRNACLDSVASGYAEQMARSGVLAHNSGAGPAVRGCRPNAAWGDNVGTAAPCDTARLEREWMASPTHRRNILDGEYTLIGVGAWTDGQGGCWVQVLFSS